ncbi:protein enabled homolog [Triticum urartu]|uniref:Uncharacterized protein n=1 Tax=Triticum urartu TaxID=4572 RepID=A0A8R7Q852_TRIUA|nr:protein enabled homolog [Triticum urartu]
MAAAPPALPDEQDHPPPPPPTRRPGLPPPRLPRLQGLGLRRLPPRIPPPPPRAPLGTPPCSASSSRTGETSASPASTPSPLRPSPSPYQSLRNKPADIRVASSDCSSQEGAACLWGRVSRRSYLGLKEFIAPLRVD